MRVLFTSTKLFIIVIAIDVAYCGYEDWCGKSNVNEKRIIRGQEADLGEYPWLARLGRVENGLTWYSCGGFLIDEYHIVTAAHCVIANGMPNPPYVN